MKIIVVVVIIVINNDNDDDDEGGGGGGDSTNKTIDSKDEEEYGTLPKEYFLCCREIEGKRCINNYHGRCSTKTCIYSDIELCKNCLEQHIHINKQTNTY